MGSGETYVFLLSPEFSQVFFHRKANTRPATSRIIIPSSPPGEAQEDRRSGFNGSKKMENPAREVRLALGFCSLIGGCGFGESGECIRGSLTHTQSASRLDKQV